MNTGKNRKKVLIVGRMPQAGIDLLKTRDDVDFEILTDDSVPALHPKLKDANVEHGKQLFQQQCFTCHTVDKGGANKAGPNQWNLVGRKKASEAGFSYSSALQAKGGDWTYEDINHMIFKPQGYVRGTKMAFAGLVKEQDRADVIAYLRTMSDSPAPLP